MTLEDRLIKIVQEYGVENGYGKLDDGTYAQPSLKQLTEAFTQITSFYGVFVEEYNEFIKEAL